MFGGNVEYEETEFEDDSIAAAIARIKKRLRELHARHVDVPDTVVKMYLGMIERLEKKLEANTGEFDSDLYNAKIIEARVTRTVESIEAQFADHVKMYDEIAIAEPELKSEVFTAEQISEVVHSSDHYESSYDSYDSYEKSEPLPRSPTPPPPPPRIDPLVALMATFKRELKTAEDAVVAADLVEANVRGVGNVTIFAARDALLIGPTNDFTGLVAMRDALDGEIKKVNTAAARVGVAAAAVVAVPGAALDVKDTKRYDAIKGYEAKLRGDPLNWINHRINDGKIISPIITTTNRIAANIDTHDTSARLKFNEVHAEITKMITVGADFAAKEAAVNAARDLLDDTKYADIAAIPTLKGLIGGEYKKAVDSKIYIISKTDAAQLDGTKPFENKVLNFYSKPYKKAEDLENELKKVHGELNAAITAITVATGPISQAIYDVFIKVRADETKLADIDAYLKKNNDPTDPAKTIAARYRTAIDDDNKVTGFAVVTYTKKAPLIKTEIDGTVRTLGIYKTDLNALATKWTPIAGVADRPYIVEFGRIRGLVDTCYPEYAATDVNEKTNKNWLNTAGPAAEGKLDGERARLDAEADRLIGVYKNALKVDRAAAVTAVTNTVAAILAITIPTATAVAAARGNILILPTMNDADAKKMRGEVKINLDRADALMATLNTDRKHGTLAAVTGIPLDAKLDTQQLIDDIKLAEKVPGELQKILDSIDADINIHLIEKPKKDAADKIVSEIKGLQDIKHFAPMRAEVINLDPGAAVDVKRKAYAAGEKLIAQTTAGTDFLRMGTIEGDLQKVIDSFNATYVDTKSYNNSLIDAKNLKTNLKDENDKLTAAMTAAATVITHGTIGTHIDAYVANVDAKWVEIKAIHDAISIYVNAEIKNTVTKTGAEVADLNTKQLEIAALLADGGMYDSGVIAAFRADRAKIHDLVKNVVPAYINDTKIEPFYIAGLRTDIFSIRLISDTQMAAKLEERYTAMSLTPPATPPSEVATYNNSHIAAFHAAQCIDTVINILCLANAKLEVAIRQYQSNTLDTKNKNNVDAQLVSLGTKVAPIRKCLGDVKNALAKMDADKTLISTATTTEIATMVAEIQSIENIAGCAQHIVGVTDGIATDAKAVLTGTTGYVATIWDYIFTPPRIHTPPPTPPRSRSRSRSPPRSRSRSPPPTPPRSRSRSRSRSPPPTPPRSRSRSRSPPPSDPLNVSMLKATNEIKENMKKMKLYINVSPDVTVNKSYLLIDKHVAKSSRQTLTWALHTNLEDKERETISNSIGTILPWANTILSELKNTEATSLLQSIESIKTDATYVTHMSAEKNVFDKKVSEFSAAREVWLATAEKAKYDTDVFKIWSDNKRTYAGIIALLVAEGKIGKDVAILINSFEPETEKKKIATGTPGAIVLATAQNLVDDMKKVTTRFEKYIAYGGAYFNAVKPWNTAEINDNKRINQVYTLTTFKSAITAAETKLAAIEAHIKNSAKTPAQHAQELADGAGKDVAAATDEVRDYIANIEGPVDVSVPTGPTLIEDMIDKIVTTNMDIAKNELIEMERILTAVKDAKAAMLAAATEVKGLAEITEPADIGVAWRIYNAEAKSIEALERYRKELDDKIKATLLKTPAQHAQDLVAGTLGQAMAAAFTAAQDYIKDAESDPTSSGKTIIQHMIDDLDDAKKIAAAEDEIKEIERILAAVHKAKQAILSQTDVHNLGDPAAFTTDNKVAWELIYPADDPSNKLKDYHTKLSNKIAAQRAKDLADAEAAKKLAEEVAKKLAEEVAKKQAEADEAEKKAEAAKQAEEDAKKRSADAAELKRLADITQLAEEAAKLAAEEAAKLAKEEAEKKAEAAKLAKEEAEKKAEEAKKKAEEEAEKKAEEAKKKAEEEAEKKAEEAKKKAEEEAEKKAEEAKKKAEEEAKKKAEEEAERNRLAAEEEAKKKAEEAKKKAEEEAKAKRLDAEAKAKLAKEAKVKQLVEGNEGKNMKAATEAAQNYVDARKTNVKPIIDALKIKSDPATIKNANDELQKIDDLIKAAADARDVMFTIEPGLEKPTGGDWKAAEDLIADAYSIDATNMGSVTKLTKIRDALADAIAAAPTVADQAADLIKGQLGLNMKKATEAMQDYIDNQDAVRLNIVINMDPDDQRTIDAANDELQKIDALIKAAADAKAAIHNEEKTRGIDTTHTDWKAVNDLTTAAFNTDTSDGTADKLRRTRIRFKKNIDNVPYRKVNKLKDGAAGQAMVAATVAAKAYIDKLAPIDDIARDLATKRPTWDLSGEILTAIDPLLAACDAALKKIKAEAKALVTGVDLSALDEKDETKVRPDELKDLWAIIAAAYSTTDDVDATKHGYHVRLSNIKKTLEAARVGKTAPEFSSAELVQRLDEKKLNAAMDAAAAAALGEVKHYRTTLTPDEKRTIANLSNGYASDADKKLAQTLIVKFKERIDAADAVSATMYSIAPVLKTHTRPTGLEIAWNSIDAAYHPAITGSHVGGHVVRLEAIRAKLAKELDDAKTPAARAAEVEGKEGKTIKAVQEYLDVEAKTNAVAGIITALAATVATEDEKRETATAAAAAAKEMGELIIAANNAMEALIKINADLKNTTRPTDEWGGLWDIIAAAFGVSGSLKTMEILIALRDKLGKARTAAGEADTTAAALAKKLNGDGHNTAMDAATTAAKTLLDGWNRDINDPTTAAAIAMDRIRRGFKSDADEKEIKDRITAFDEKIKAAEAAREKMYAVADVLKNTGKKNINNMLWPAWDLIYAAFHAADAKGDIGIVTQLEAAHNELKENLAKATKSVAEYAKNLAEGKLGLDMEAAAKAAAKHVAKDNGNGSGKESDKTINDMKNVDTFALAKSIIEDEIDIIKDLIAEAKEAKDAMVAKAEELDIEIKADTKAPDGFKEPFDIIAKAYRAADAATGTAGGSIVEIGALLKKYEKALADANAELKTQVEALKAGPNAEMKEANKAAAEYILAHNDGTKAADMKTVEGLIKRISDARDAMYVAAPMLKIAFIDDVPDELKPTWRLVDASFAVGGYNDMLAAIKKEIEKVDPNIAIMEEVKKDTAKFKDLTRAVNTAKGIIEYDNTGRNRKLFEDLETETPKEGDLKTAGELMTRIDKVLKELNTAKRDLENKFPALFAAATDISQWSPDFEKIHDAYNKNEYIVKIAELGKKIKDVMSAKEVDPKITAAVKELKNSGIDEYTAKSYVEALSNLREYNFKIVTDDIKIDDIDSKMNAGDINARCDATDIINDIDDLIRIAIYVKDVIFEKLDLEPDTDLEEVAGFPPKYAHILTLIADIFTSKIDVSDDTSASGKLKGYSQMLRETMEISSTNFMGDTKTPDVAAKLAAEGAYTFAVEPYFLDTLKSINPGTPEADAVFQLYKKDWFDVCSGTLIDMVATYSKDTLDEKAQKRVLTATRTAKQETLISSIAKIYITLAEELKTDGIDDTIVDKLVDDIKMWSNKAIILFDKKLPYQRLQAKDGKLVIVCALAPLTWNNVFIIDAQNNIVVATSPTEEEKGAGDISQLAASVNKYQRFLDITGKEVLVPRPRDITNIGRNQLDPYKIIFESKLLSREKLDNHMIYEELIYCNIIVRPDEGDPFTIQHNGTSITIGTKDDSPYVAAYITDKYDVKAGDVEPVFTIGNRTEYLCAVVGNDRIYVHVDTSGKLILSKELKIDNVIRIDILRQKLYTETDGDLKLALKDDKLNTFQLGEDEVGTKLKILWRTTAIDDDIRTDLHSQQYYGSGIIATARKVGGFIALTWHLHLLWAVVIILVIMAIILIATNSAAMARAKHILRRRGGDNGYNKNLENSMPVYDPSENALGAH